MKCVRYFAKYKIFTVINATISVFPVFSLKLNQLSWTLIYLERDGECNQWPHVWLARHLTEFNAVCCSASALCSIWLIFLPPFLSDALLNALPSSLTTLLIY